MAFSSATISRREALVGLGTGALALTLPACATVPAAPADPQALLDDIAYNLLGHEPERATSLGVEASESCPELCKVPQTGDLLLIWNASRFDPKWASHFGKRTPLSAAISKDGGKTWSKPRHIETDPGWAFSNPGAYFMRDGNLFLNYWACKYTDKGYVTNYPIDLKAAIVETAWLYGESER